MRVIARARTLQRPRDCGSVGRLRTHRSGRCIIRLRPASGLMCSGLPARSPPHSSPAATAALRCRATFFADMRALCQRPPANVGRAARATPSYAARRVPIGLAPPRWWAARAFGHFTSGGETGVASLWTGALRWLHCGRGPRRRAPGCACGGRVGLRAAWAYLQRAGGEIGRPLLVAVLLETALPATPRMSCRLSSQTSRAHGFDRQ